MHAAPHAVPMGRNPPLRFFVPRPKFRSYAELNAWLEDRCIAYAKAYQF